MKYWIKNFDLIIIGSGGAGLMAAILAAQKGVKKIAIISKVIPTNSHTVAAKGGINASLGNVVKDDWKYHAYDTIKGSNYLADIDAVEILCKNANEAVISLEEMGADFCRDANGKIAQRAYGGQTLNYGKGGLAYRACYSKDKTGHTILHSLYQRALEYNIEFYSEFFVTDLFIEDKKASGCLAIDLNKGEFVVFQAKNTIIATGGFSQIYKNSTSSAICTGDGNALILENGLPLQDMEFIQFHPTGIHNQGFLITEAARSEGAYLLNCNNERFMKNYDEKMMELSCRDKISQAIATEIHQGRGCGKNKDYILLDMRHIDEEILKDKLPGAVEVIEQFAKLDVKKDLIPVSPSAHYAMGGIPTNLNCEVINDKEEKISGLMAVGETACISVHGANRLGCNSLLDLIVFGKIAGERAAKNDKIAQNFIEKSQILAKIDKIKEIFAENEHNNQTSLFEIKTKLQQNNENTLGVFRSEELMKQGKKRLDELYEIFKKYRIKDHNLLFNNELIAYFELKNLFLNSFVLNYSSSSRKESRGAHYRIDYANINDDEFLYHSLVKYVENNLEFSTRKVR